MFFPSGQTFTALQMTGVLLYCWPDLVHTHCSNHTVPHCFISYGMLLLCPQHHKFPILRRLPQDLVLESHISLSSKQAQMILQEWLVLCTCLGNCVPLIHITPNICQTWRSSQIIFDRLGIKWMYISIKKENKTNSTLRNAGQRNFAVNHCHSSAWTDL